MKDEELGSIHEKSIGTCIVPLLFMNRITMVQVGWRKSSGKHGSMSVDVGKRRNSYNKWKETTFLLNAYSQINIDHWLNSALDWLQVAEDGIPLPPDRTICPLCSEKRANPSVVAVSGFVFCYTCIFKYISQVKANELIIII